MGLVVAIADPATEADRVWTNASRHGEDCMFLTFSPPHRSVVPALCPVVPVFAWEFDTIPTEIWEDEPRHDWRTVLKACGRAITHSTFAAETVRAQMGRHYPIASLPAPVWDRFAPLFGRRRAGAVMPVTNLTVRGRVYDTCQLELGAYTPLAWRERDHASALTGAFAETARREATATIRLGGVIYTSVLCPTDGRKNWFDMVCGFCWALGEHEDATLVLKLTHHDCGLAILAILRDLAKLPPFRCRVVIIDGYLDDETYLALAALSSYAVNTSHGEGQCLPLMEYMSAGAPAVSPAHTAMADYVHPGNAFIVASSREPASWPHDPRQAIRARRHRICFSSLVAAYQDSYHVAHHHKQLYARMSERAHRDLARHCSADAIAMGLRSFLALPEETRAMTWRRDFV